MQVGATIGGRSTWDMPPCRAAAEIPSVVSDSATWSARICAARAKTWVSYVTASPGV